MKALHYLSKFHDAVAKTCFMVSAGLILFLTINIGYEVVSRYFFGQPTAWALDFSEYILIYSTFLAAPWMLKIGGHVSINVMVDHFTNKTRLALKIFNGLVGCGVSAIVAWQLSCDTVDAFQRNILIVRPILIPKYTIMWVIPFGAILLFFFFLKDIILAIKMLRTGAELE